MALECLEFTGSFREIGRQHGEALREGAEAMCETRIELSLSRARKTRPDVDLDHILAVAARHLAFHERYCPDSYEEFLGISEGAGIAPERLLIGNGYTDFVDVVTIGNADICECTHITAAGPATADALTLVGQTWDMSFSAARHVVCIRRKPTGAPATVGITTAGCLSLIGVNEAGIAIGNTNLQSTDARPGVIYLATINHALAATTFEDALERVIHSPRASGHFYYVGGPDGSMAGLETSATAHATLSPDASGLLSHANHYVDSRMRAYEGGGAPGVNSVDRQGRARQLLDAAGGTLDVCAMHAVLSDHHGANPICRHTQDPAGAGTLAAAVMTPQKREISLCIGNACTGEFHTLTP
ncbi:MAG TPA: hypothetical protein DGT21_14505 [Armatimonadetes bacterium]|jgi:isopenicillin-N N-acyltransferase-like protein|nr:hypothetical protein [Armatimonadota bacterium]